MRTRRAARAGGAGAVPPDRLHDQLPDHLLELCMPSYAPADFSWHPCNLRLVCKRWKRIVDGSPRLTQGRMCAFPQRHYLQRDGGGAATAPPPDAAALARLASCRAAVVQHAELCDVHVPGLLEAVQQLTCLTSLQLCADSSTEYRHERAGQVLAQRQLGLGALPQLCGLRLRVAGLLEPTCQQLSAARNLTALEVGDFLYEVPDALWDSLTCMPDLAQLEISVHTHEGRTVAIGSGAWQRLAACTQLARLKLEEGTIDGGIDESGYFEVQPGLTQLTALRDFELHGNVASLGDLWQHTGLTRLVLLDAEQAFPYPQDGSRSLPAVTVAAVGSSKREMPPFWGGLLASTLRHVTELSLHSSRSEFWDDEEEGQDDQAFDRLGSLRKLEALHTLKLEATLGSIPRCVRELTTLKLLDVSHCKLRELPEGPYLLGLRTLLMPGHHHERLPPALATARSLEVLDVSTGYYPGPVLLLQPQDLSALVAMPALRLLCLPDYAQLYQGGPGVRAAGAQQVALFTIFCALLPRLAVMPYSTIHLLGLCAGGTAGGLQPAWLHKLQACMRPSWAALGQEAQRNALAALRGAADAQQLSPQAAALLAAFVENTAGDSSRAG